MSVLNNDKYVTLLFLKNFLNEGGFWRGGLGVWSGAVGGGMGDNNELFLKP